MRTKTAVLAAGVATGAIAATLLSGTTAQAYPRIQTIGLHCFGANPNIVGFPFFGGANVTTNSPVRGQISINSDSKDVLPYTTYSTVRVTSLRTNKTQTFRRTWQHSMGDIGGYRIDGIRASGRVKVTVSSVNRGLFQTLTGPTCSGIVTV
ncbi:hypothetical protein GOEFS_054_00100 [Gordonia effusa NBRC 100432]|uniref:Uncharacterized protein n=1 Tax=Gordonia effusa NBRC 100432 TaxID=1077974 RepID=H0QZZ6_9ACTN|nr:hypothetical protein [Gordonia effusa]GAB18397.1 hypothetical protein GOEFS_054_00100 [Gordonia effusa NBRC 100432]